MKYKAFISYKHDSFSRAFAESIEDAVKSFGKPLLQRPMAIFRDEKMVKPGKDLPQEIKNGLQESEYLIYLAPKDAAKAPWVEDEIKFWSNDLKRGEKFIIAVIEDKIFLKGSGNTEEIDWENTTILPAELKSRYLKNPLFLNFSWAQKKINRKKPR